jgi:hypothetical protein
VITTATAAKPKEADKKPAPKASADAKKKGKK